MSSRRFRKLQLLKGERDAGSSESRLRRVEAPAVGAEAVGAGMLGRMARAARGIFFAKKRPLIFFLGSFLYFVFLLVIFLYVTFPYQKLEARLLSWAEEALSARIIVGERRWVYPVGLDLRRVRIQPEAGFSGVLQLDQAKARLYLLPLLGQRVESDFFMEAYGGKIRGSLVTWVQDGKRHSYVQQTAQDLDLAKMEMELPLRLLGRLRMGLEANWEGPTPLRGRGSGDLELIGIQMAGLNLNGWNLPDLSFRRISARIKLENGVIQVESLTADGTQIDLTGSGTLVMRHQWAQALLNLTLRATLKAGLAADVPALAMLGTARDPVEVSVKGTVGRPLVSVNGVPINL